MQLELSTAEATVLREVLTSHLAGLRVEIGRADHREYREMLRRRDELLEHVLAQLGPAEAGQ